MGRAEQFEPNKHKQNRVAATEKHNLSCLSYGLSGNVLRLKHLNLIQTFVKTETVDGVHYFFNPE